MSPLRLLRAFAVLAALLVLLPLPAAAASSEWARTEQVEVRLLSAVTATGEAGEVQLGLQFRMQPGWKIYWRAPGDAGYPPSLKWLDGNVEAATIAWPLPHRFEVLGLQSIGYADEVILPVTARLRQPGAALAARAEVDYLTCAEICIPQQAVLSLDLPAGPAEASPFAHDIGRWLARVPGDGARHGLTLERLESWGEGDAAVVRAVVAADPPLTAPDMFVEAPDYVQLAPPRLRLEQGGRRAILEAAVVKGTGAGSLVGKPLTVTIGEDARGLEAALAPVLGDPAPSGAGTATILGMIGAALLGGLILNLMPCVLPVLSIKVLGLIGHGGAERRHIRQSFIASSAGIVASFLLLAAAAVAVKAAGMAIGWGIQFQQPLFLVFLVVVLTLFAANLWGFYEIRLPHWLGGVGAGYGNPHSMGGHFLSGAFATLLATPCSAPFLGTAVGFALGHGPLEIFAIFAALGVGMAAPYLLVAAWPELARRLPRPGRWMVGLRWAMGLALAATAAWLLTVLAAQTGLEAAAMVAGLMLALTALLALRRRLAGAMRAAAVAGVAALSALAFLPPLQATATPGLRDTMKSDAAWVNFDRDAIARLVGEGKTVFVDVTADWCITCQVNKAAVINRGRVAEELERPDVVAMKADWTKPDDGIAAYLASYGRYGIPFNAVYGPGAPNGVVLPELLTEGVVMDAFAKAKGVLATRAD